MRKSILFKTFIYTVVLCMGLFFIHFAAQELFLSKYYRKIKLDMIEHDVHRLRDNLQYEELSADKVRSEILDFSVKNRISVELIDEHGRGVFGSSSKYNEGFVEFIDENGEDYQVSLEFVGDKSHVKVGSKIETTGVLFNYGSGFNMIMPYNVVVDDVDVSAGEGNANEYSKDGEIKVQGKITKMVERISTKPYTFEATFSKLINIMKENGYKLTRRKDEILWDVYFDKNSGYKYETYRTHIEINGTVYSFIGSLAVESINDTLAVIRIYNIYLLIFVFIFVMIGSYLYARKMTSPMIHIRNIAKKMSSLDFSDKVKIKTKDEMGQLGESLNKLGENLQRSIKELKRTNQILQDDIEKEKNRERNRRRLVANLSHELKTPLTIIEGIASGIRDGLYEGDEKKYILSIIEEIGLMNDVIFDMLELSKIEDESFKLEKNLFDLSGVFLRINNKMRNLAEEKNIKVNIETDEVVVNGDINKIEQVIRNFYSNAIRYTEEGKNIYIRIYEMKNYGVFEIENEGAFISHNEQINIWDAFYRCEKSRSRELGGTGLGLKIVKEILNHHGADYGTYNSDKGVVFYFKLKKIR